MVSVNSHYTVTTKIMSINKTFIYARSLKRGGVFDGGVTITRAHQYNSNARVIDGRNAR